MRVCLIIPPSAFLLDDRVFTSLGILRVAAVLLEKGVKVDLLDLSGNKDYHAEIEAYQPGEDVTFGITATTPQLQNAVQLSRLLRPRGKVILGGAHPSLVNAAHKRIGGRATKALNELLEEFDTIVAGDGEEAIWPALKQTGLIDADIPKDVLFLTNKKLNELPLPARHLVDLRSYHFNIGGEATTSLIAQLGCPFGCGFCGGRNTSFLRKIRTRTSENVVAELKQVYLDYGYKGFMFHDDELNVNPKVVELMQQIRRLQDDLGVQFKMRGFIKAELFTDAIAKAMAEAHFTGILVGFESGSARILENIKKRATQDDNTRCWELAAKYGIKVKALMSLGHPGESRDTIEETKAWLHKMPTENRDDIDFTIIAVYPGTPYYDEAVETKEGWCYTVNGDHIYSEEIDCRFVNNYYKGAPDAYNSFIHTDYLTSHDLIELRYQAETEFGKQIPYKGITICH
jgi:anaerobic magnesium-protoporphyrin IX monomethyl ester cyclase